METESREVAGVLCLLACEVACKSEGSNTANAEYGRGMPAGLSLSDFTAEMSVPCLTALAGKNPDDSKDAAESRRPSDSGRVDEARVKAKGME